MRKLWSDPHYRRRNLLARAKNHRVVAVEDAGFADVYDISVPNYENFALSCGVFVHNSQESLQAWRAMGVPADVLSIDKDTAAYDSLKDALYEGRVSWYRNETLRRELLGLQLSYKQNRAKVDHPQRGSKDLADAAAGVAHHWTLDPPRTPVLPQPGKVETVVTGLTFDKDTWDWLRR